MKGWGKIVIGRCAFLYLMAGCAVIIAHSAVLPLKSVAEQALTLREEDNGKVIDLHVNTEIRVELSGTPATGYWWYLQDLDEEFLELVKDETRDLAPPGIHGGKIVGTWLLRPNKPGTVFLKLIHHRPWEQGTKASRSFCVELRIAE